MKKIKLPMFVALLYTVSFCNKIYAQSFTLSTELRPGDTAAGIYSHSQPDAVTFNIENTNDTAYTLKQVEKYMNWARIHSGTIPRLWYSATSLAGPSTISETNGWAIVATGAPLYYSHFGAYPLFQELNFVIPPHTQYRFALECSKGLWAGYTLINTYNYHGIILRVGYATLPGNSEDTVGCLGIPPSTEEPFGFLGRVTLEPASTTPVTLLNFTASYDNISANHIHWQTSQEINSKSFTLQKAYALPQFNNVATLPAAGHSNTLKNYAYTDKQIQYRPTYYRLQQTDADGKTSYSKTLLLHPTKNSFTIGNLYPSPAQTHITIEYNSPGGGITSLAIQDMAGRLLLQKNIPTTPGFNSTHLPVQALAKGLYTLLLIQGDKRVHTKFVKQ